MKHFIGFQIMNLLNSSLSNYLCFMWVISSYVIDSNGPIRWTFWWFFKVPPVDKPYVFFQKWKSLIKNCFLQCFINSVKMWLYLKPNIHFTMFSKVIFNKEWQYRLKNARFKLSIFKANLVPIQNQPNWE